MTPLLCWAAVYKSPSENIAQLELRGQLVQSPLKDDAACFEGWGAGNGFVMCLLFAPWRETNSGENHTKNTKRGDTSKHRCTKDAQEASWQIPVLEQMRMDKVWGEDAAKYFIPDTTSTQDLQRS